MMQPTRLMSEMGELTGLIPKGGICQKVDPGESTGAASLEPSDAEALKGHCAAQDGASSGWERGLTKTRVLLIDLGEGRCWAKRVRTEPVPIISHLNQPTAQQT
jgi:hypothetical protein